MLIDRLRAYQMLEDYTGDGMQEDSGRVALSCAIEALMQTARIETATVVILRADCHAADATIHENVHTTFDRIKAMNRVDVEKLVVRLKESRPQ